MAITRVQSITGNSNGTTALALVLGAAPANGNLLALSVGFNAIVGPASVTSTDDITWSGPSKSGTTAAVMLLIGYVRTASASATVTITFPASTACAAVCAEYSGITYPRIDRAASTTGNSSVPASGASSTTRSANELWVCAIGQRATNTPTFSSPTNSFAIVGQNSSTLNTTNNDRAATLLEKIVSATGTANGGVTSTQSNTWAAYALTIDDVIPVYATIGGAGTTRVGQ